LINSCYDSLWRKAAAGQMNRRHPGYSNIVLVKANCQGVSFAASGKACKSRNKFGDLTAMLAGFCIFRPSINITIVFTPELLFAAGLAVKSFFRLLLPFIKIFTKFGHPPYKKMEI
jgi:hypothetical protein